MLFNDQMLADLAEWAGKPNLTSADLDQVEQALELVGIAGLVSEEEAREDSDYWRDRYDTAADDLQILKDALLEIVHEMRHNDEWDKEDALSELEELAW